MFGTVVTCLELIGTEQHFCYNSKQPLRRKKSKTIFFRQKICPFSFGKESVNVSSESPPHQRCLVSLHIVWDPHEERDSKTFVCMYVLCQPCR